MQRRGDDSPHYRVASDSAEKVFAITATVAAATYGVATIGTKTIRSLIEEYAPPEGADVFEVAESLASTFADHLHSAQPGRQGGDVKVSDLQWALGFLVAGYDADGIGRLLDVQVRPVAPRVVPANPTTENPGVIARGQVDAINRLLDGVDWQGVEKMKVDLGEDARAKLGLLRYDLIFSHTIDDAIALSEFLVDTQVQAQRFSDGTFASPSRIPGCGGATRVLSVTRAGVEWRRNAGEPLASPAQGTAASVPAAASGGSTPPSERSALRQTRQ